MSFPVYEDVKGSGVDWLGEVPFHWGLSRLGFESWVRARLGWKGLKADEYVDDGYVFLATPNIKGRDVDFQNVNYINQERFDESPEIKLAVGDVLLAKDGSTLGTVNVVRSLPRPSTVNSSIAVITPKESVYSVFLYYLFRSSFMEQTIQEIKGGMGVPHLFQADLVKFRLPLPPLDEQIAISSFLDTETSKIDGLVSEQRRLVELLKEKRQAVISQAVTKGLNPKATMKLSGIDWVGEIPEHWGTPPVFARYFAVLGKMLDERKLTGQHPIRYLRNADVNWDSINTVDLPVFDIEPDEYERFTVLPGDILICEGGAGIGQTAIWQGELERCAFQKALHRLRPWNPDRENPRFFYYCMRYVVETGVVLAGGTATIPHLTGEQLRKYRFPRPPKEEQDEIVDFLNAKIARFTALESEAEQAIELLHERRTALISAAVTGKIDVRDFMSEEAVA